jgi:hypothetical protein
VVRRRVVSEGQLVGCRIRKRFDEGFFVGAVRQHEIRTGSVADISLRFCAFHVWLCYYWRSVGGS